MNPLIRLAIIQSVLQRNEASPYLRPVRDGNGVIISTYCNVAVWNVGKAICSYLGFDDAKGAPLMADQIDTYCNATPTEWEPVPLETCQALADAGEWILLTHPYSGHGHVATVQPGQAPVFSGKWNMEVPTIANVGQTNGIMGANFAFPVTDTPPSAWRFLK